MTGHDRETLQRMLFDAQKEIAKLREEKLFLMKVVADLQTDVFKLYDRLRVLGQEP